MYGASHTHSILHVCCKGFHVIVCVCVCVCVFASVYVKCMCVRSMCCA